MRNGLLLNDITCVYLKCDGLDFDFGFHPSGAHALRLSDLMSGAGLEYSRAFSAMIQSGKDIFWITRPFLPLFFYTYWGRDAYGF